MSDRELLEAAAKLAGISGVWSDYHQGICHSIRGSLDMHIWRPLTDDGDALRLAVKLGLHIECPDGNNKRDFVAVRTAATGNWIEYREPTHDGRFEAATRRAIVRAAAALNEPKEQK